MNRLPDLSEIEGFEWDQANTGKIWQRHHVTFHECEEVFFHEPFGFAPDLSHSVVEQRYFAYGRTTLGRLLTIIFTIRSNRIRVISARDMSRKERKLHEKIQTGT